MYGTLLRSQNTLLPPVAKTLWVSILLLILPPLQLCYSLSPAARVTAAILSAPLLQAPAFRIAGGPRQDLAMIMERSVREDLGLIGEDSSRSALHPVEQLQESLRDAREAWEKEIAYPARLSAQEREAIFRAFHPPSFYGHQIYIAPDLPPAERKALLHFFDHSMLRDTRFWGDMSGFSFKGADLRGADLSEAKWYKNDFTGALIDSHTTFGEASFCSCTFENMTLEALALSNNFAGSSFARSTLRDVDFYYASLRKSSFQGAILDGVRFRHADMRSTFPGQGRTPYLRGGLLFDDNFSESLLRSMRFSNRRPSSNRLGRSLLKANLFFGYSLPGIDFSSACLTNVDFSGSNLHHANFSGARIVNTRPTPTFAGANLQDADFLDAVVAPEELLAAKNLSGITLNLELAAELLLQGGFKLSNAILRQDFPDSTAYLTHIGRSGVLGLKLDCLRIEALDLSFVGEVAGPDLHRLLWPESMSPHSSASMEIMF